MNHVLKIGTLGCLQPARIVRPMIQVMSQKLKILFGILLKLINMQQFIFVLNVLQSIWVYQQQAVEHRMVFPKDIFGPFDVLQVS